MQTKSLLAAFEKLKVTSQKAAKASWQRSATTFLCEVTICCLFPQVIGDNVRLADEFKTNRNDSKTRGLSPLLSEL